MIKITRTLEFPDMTTEFFKSSVEQKAILKSYKDEGSILSDELTDNRLNDLTVTYIVTWISEEKLNEYNNLPAIVENRKNRTDYYTANNITLTETKEVI